MLRCYKPELNAVLTPASSALHHHLSCYLSHSILKIVRTRGKMHTTEVIQLTICKQKLFFFVLLVLGVFLRACKRAAPPQWAVNALGVQPFAFTCSHMPAFVPVGAPAQAGRKRQPCPSRGNWAHCTTSYQPLLLVSRPEDAKIRKQVLYSVLFFLLIKYHSKNTTGLFLTMSYGYLFLAISFDKKEMLLT